MTMLTARQEFQGPAPYRFTRDEYYKMTDAGLFRDKRVELIDGEVFNMAPQRDLHAITLGIVTATIQKVFPDDWVRAQLPLTFDIGTEPEPDIAVVRGKPRDYLRLGHHPATALLLIEIADTSLRHDRKVKCRLYAAAGILDYWIVNLVDGQLEIYREPVGDTTDPTSYDYRSTQILSHTESISPLANPTAQIRIADLFP